ncbi:MAG: hypothetical protein QOE97_2469 [Pseudonocardiales bacterium]|jgi:DNA invertase Pin-like site-specific DNA recombinase|nr:hypothetical protein [Pseudonocardiales bacterium]
MSETDPTRIGYARVSTTDQDPALQLDALTSAGCAKVFTDHASGSLRERPELKLALDYLRPGDTLVIWRLDRLGRSVRHLIETVALLEDRGIGLRSLQESLDTSSPSGKLVFHVFASLAEFERALIIERTNAGLAVARARGRVGGRPRILTGERLGAARTMYASGQYSVAAIARTVGVSRATLYRCLSESR